MQRSRKMLALVILLSVLVVGIGYSVLKYAEKITNTANILGYGVKLFRTDTSAIVTTIPWGDIEVGTNKTSETIFSFTKKLALKNTGDFDSYLGWKLNSTLVNGIILTCDYYYLDRNEWRPLPQNTYEIVGGLDGWIQVPKDALSQYVRWTLDVPNDAPRGAINFDIVLLTATTPSG